MKLIFITISLLFSLVTFGQNITNIEGSDYKFSKVAHLDATPVQSQGRTGTCWSFSALSFFESELIRKGNSSKVLNLSNIQKKEDFNIQEQPYDDNTKTNYNKELIDSNIDLTTFTNENLKITYENVTRKNPLLYLKISRKDGGNSKVRIILENKKILIITTDSLKVKGKLKFINKDSIQLKSTSIAINKIMIIKKPINAARITGNIIGGLFSYVGVAASIDLYEPIYLLIGSAISIPFYAMNYVRRKYHLKSKWKAEIVYEKK